MERQVLQKDDAKNPETEQGISVSLLPSSFEFRLATLSLWARCSNSSDLLLLAGFLMHCMSALFPQQEHRDLSGDASLSSPGGEVSVFVSLCVCFSFPWACTFQSSLLVLHRSAAPRPDLQLHLSFYLGRFNGAVTRTERLNACKKDDDILKSFKLNRNSQAALETSPCGQSFWSCIATYWLECGAGVHMSFRLFIQKKRLN